MDEFIKKKLCDGEFVEVGEMRGCHKGYTYIARDPEDPVCCVFYCCEEHLESYKKAGFLIGH